LFSYFLSDEWTPSFVGASVRMVELDFSVHFMHDELVEKYNEVLFIILFQQGKQFTMTTYKVSSTY